MTSVDDAITRILEAVTPLPPETVGLSDGLGRVLAADVVARVTQPPVAISAMDGYAVRAEDVVSPPVTLNIRRKTLSSAPLSATDPILL